MLYEAAAGCKRVRMNSSDTTSVASLLPVKRSRDTVAFCLSDKRYLRIAKNGQTDLKGVPGGPWTEFRVESSDCGAVSLQAVKSGRWLTVQDGEFASSEKPVLLALEVGATLSKHEGINDVDDDVDAHAAKTAPLKLVGGTRALPWSVQQDGRHVLLASAEGNLVCGPMGRFKSKCGVNGKWAQWELRETPEGITLKSVGHGQFLSFDARGSPQLSDSPALFAPTSAGDLSQPVMVDTSVVSREDFERFKKDGFLIIRQAVPEQLVCDLLRAINHALGKPGCWNVENDRLNKSQLKLNLPNKESLSSDVSSSPKLWSALNLLLGAGNVSIRKNFQVALRFPEPVFSGLAAVDEKEGTRWHIDGVDLGQKCPFTLLCGVCLSDQSKPNVGNLHVYPGEHMNQSLHQWYRGMFKDDCDNPSDEGKPRLGKSVQVLLSPGDVVIAHQMLPHAIGQNYSPNIRYQLYLRVDHKRHEEYRNRVVDDIFVEYAS